MTTRCLLALAFASISSAAIAAPLPSYDDATLRAVQFVDAHEGWAVGDEGIILHSIDGGKTWERQKSGTRASLRAVHFLTPYTGWTVGRIENPSGSSGVLLRTTDGGLSWVEVSANLLPGLNTVRFFDDKIGIVTGDASNAFPSGVFATNDAGASWSPFSGPSGQGLFAADFTEPDHGLIAGAWGQVSTLAKNLKTPLALDISCGRAVRAVKQSGRHAILAGDGGMVYLATDASSGSWSPANLPLTPAVRSVCDFHCAALHGEKIWLAGRPGSVVLFSPDFGKTWELRKTGSPVPIRGLCMLSDTLGWAVGELGTILSTTDGGKTWATVRSGGHRAAVLFANATPASVPLAALPGLAAADGYLATALTLASADPATASPDHALDPFRLAAAVRSAGGAAADPIFGFALPDHCDGITAEQLLAFWDAPHGGKAREHLLRQMVLAVRMWRPDVIVTDAIAPDTPAADQVMLFAIQEAFKQAADPAAFPEQIEHLALFPHAAKKLYARTADLAQAQVRIDTAAFRPDLADSPALASEAGTHLLTANPTPKVLAFRLVSHRLDGAERHAALTDGCDLARGGTARRKAAPGAFNPEYIAMRQRVTQARDQLAALLAPATLEKDGETAFTRVVDVLKTIPDLDAAAALLAAAKHCEHAGRWTAARELCRLAATRYPTQPATADAYRWLVRYHASGEALRRVELAQHPTYPATDFIKLPLQPKDGVVQASFAEPGGPRVRFRSAEAERAWLGMGVDLEPRLFATDPASLRDPAIQLALAAGRKRLGLNADADAGLRAGLRGFGKMATSPWIAALDTELWLADRSHAETPAKPIAACRFTETKPHLDGKLDDACWKAATPLPVSMGPSDLAKTHPTEARLAFDEEFLYIAITCGHPMTEPAAKPTRRRRDEDLAGRDRVELLLDIDRDYQTYYRFRVDHRGCVAEDCSGDRTWDPRWFVAVEPTPTAWTAELAIPLAELTNNRPRPTQLWATNLTRILPAQGILNWTTPANATPRPEGMGLIEFRR